MSGRDVQDRDDFYSQVKGRKFLIPFFDDDYEGASMKVKTDLNELTALQRLAYEKYIKCIKDSLLEQKTLKYRWQKRGVAKILLQQIIDEG
jgi:truncated hemoglobin YjbI